jgi:alpha-tubulin suppressor-like RCC1 family protein
VSWLPVPERILPYRAKAGFSVAVGFTLTFLLSAGSNAYWSVIGGGAGNGSVGVLASPHLAGAPGAGTATLSWTAVAPLGGGSVVYYVQRDGAAASGDCPAQAAPTAVLTCTDGGLDKGTHTYVVTAVYMSWTAASVEVPVTLASGPVDHFVVTAATTTPTAGQPDNLTIAAFDAAGNAAVDYAGTICLTFSGPGLSPNGTPPAYPAPGPCSGGHSAVTFAAGVAAAGPASIVVTDSAGHSNGAGLAVVVGPAGLSAFAVPTPISQVAGVQFPVSITARDTYGNTASGYTGARCLVFSGPGSSPNGTAPVYPPRGACAAGQSSVTFASGVAAAVPITLYNPAVATILTVTDAPSGKTGSTSAFTVQAGPVAVFTIPTPTEQVAGVQFTVTITATDAYGSPAASYAGTKCLTFSGPASSPNGTVPAYPARGSCASGQSAVTFAGGVATGVPITLYAASSSTILTATDGSLTGSTGTFGVVGAAVSSLAMSASTTTPEAGAADSLTIRAVDAFGNTSTGYTGAHSLTFSGATAVPNSPFGPTVTDGSGAARAFGSPTTINFANGVASVSGGANGVLRLYRAGTISIVVTDGTHSNGGGLSVTVHVVVTAVAAGGFHSCALLSYGGIECWGRNNYGQLGNPTSYGTSTAVSTPVAVTGITNAVQIEAGEYHTCAVLDDHTIACWGSDVYGQLGDSPGNDTSAVPLAVSGVTNAIQVTAGAYHSCATLADGTARCWGYNNNGQLGDGTATQRTTPVAVDGVGGHGTLAGVTQVSAGAYQSCAVLSSGGAVCWGSNRTGELGDGTRTERHSPVDVEDVTGHGSLSGVVQISAGGTETNNNYFGHTCAVLTGGGIVCWGYGHHGEMGNGTTTNRNTDPVAVSNIDTATQVSVGEYRACARLADGSALCWGYNGSGQLGDGSTTQRLTPVAVLGVGGSGNLSGIVSVTAGGEYSQLNPTGDDAHTCALFSDGSVACWGDNTFGQLGDGSTTERHTPVVAQLQ